jgi:hypothetical protein
MKECNAKKCPKFTFWLEEKRISPKMAFSADEITNIDGTDWRSNVIIEFLM